MDYVSPFGKQGKTKSSIGIHDIKKDEEGHKVQDLQHSTMVGQGKNT
jgi:hypothetical protein